MALSARPRVRAVGAFFRETAVIGALYGLWHLAGQVSVSHVAGLPARALDPSRRDVPAAAVGTHGAAGRHRSPRRDPGGEPLLRLDAPDDDADLPGLAVRPASRPLPAGAAGDGLDHARLPADPARAGGPAADDRRDRRHRPPVRPVGVQQRT